jgi:ribosomal protein S18 acetylase RimI-like enzyme
LTAAVASRYRGQESGLSPTHARRDMAGIAELMAMSFSGNLDSISRRMIRDMRRLGRLGWLGWLLGKLVLPPAAYAPGFVWRADGKVVGNASLMYVDRRSSRYVIANVAVHPGYRRKGIARSLVEACVEFCREKKGTELLLQVDRDNHAAQVLYASMGFKALSTRTKWVRPNSHTQGLYQGMFRVRQRDPGEWQQQYELARLLYPEGVWWPYSNRIEYFRPRELAHGLGLRGSIHWVIERQGRLIASLMARSGFEPGSWRLVLMVEPEVQGQVEEALLAKALPNLFPRRMPVIVEYQAGIAEEAFTKAGFTAERTLTWMKRDVS